MRSATSGNEGLSVYRESHETTKGESQKMQVTVNRLHTPVLRGRVNVHSGMVMRGGNLRSTEDVHSAVRVMPASELRPGRLPNGLPEHVRRPRYTNKSRNNIRLVL